MKKEEIIEIINKNRANLDCLEKNTDSILKASDMILNCFKNGGKILICGNGGSAAESQHMSAELVGRFQKNRQALPAIALTTDTSIITSISNDYSFEEIFSRQVSALGKENDILFAISTSGNSRNVIKAIEEAREKKMKVISLIGQSGKMKELSDLALTVNDTVTARIQEMHLLIIHLICQIVEEKY
jgi:D-sedoheptulose 7-phosphate isomerase